jgi:hypothetical protein
VSLPIVHLSQFFNSFNHFRGKWRLTTLDPLVTAPANSDAWDLGGVLPPTVMAIISPMVPAHARDCHPTACAPLNLTHHICPLLDDANISFFVYFNISFFIYFSCALR